MATNSRYSMNIFSDFLRKTGDSPAILDVLVDEARDAHGDEGKVPAGHEHDGQAQAEPEHRQGPGN
jgi:hypothetical protein